MTFDLDWDHRSRDLVHREGAMSEVIQTGSFERMDRFHYDVVDEVQIMAEAGERNELPNSLPFVPAGLLVEARRRSIPKPR